MEKDSVDAWGDAKASVEVGAPPSRDCHYDCFGGVTCRDGVVTRRNHGPISCSAWQGSCPTQVVGTCKQGCGAETLPSDPGLCAMDICKEKIPKNEGDPCVSDADCLPTRAVANAASTTVTQTYLRCDVAMRICTRSEGPVVSDWLQTCDPSVLARFEKGVPGSVADASCSEGLCVFYVPHDRSCIYQGCSKRCERDDQCPQGAVCQDGATEYCIAGGPFLSRPAGMGYCKPGRLNSIGEGLMCW